MSEIDTVRASIAMAVFNGEKFLPQQIESIINQLGEHDEIIISYDPSSDRTYDIIQDYHNKDQRIKIYINEEHKKGLVSNFENALYKCKGKYIFFSDQDDVWLSGKIETLCKVLENANVTAVVHDSIIIDENDKQLIPSTFSHRWGGRGDWFTNLVRLSYIGCCMGFKREMLEYILPIPLAYNAHDWWTGTICSMCGKMIVVNTPLIYHRLHQNNATPKKSPSLKHKVKIRSLIFFHACVRLIPYIMHLRKNVL